MLLKFPNSIKKSTVWKAPANRAGFLRLDLNENDSLFTGQLFNDFRKFDHTLLTTYPEYDELLLKLAKYTNAKTKQIALTNGADQAIDIVLRLLFKKGDRVVMPSPVFSLYDHFLKILETEARHVSYIDNKTTFTFPHEQVIKELNGAQGLILCSPNNPLGSGIDKKDLLELIKQTSSHNIPCVIDEAYFEFGNETVASLISKYPNLIIVRTFSKMFGLAGVRLGYVIAHQGVVNQILKLRGPWDINSFAVFAGVKALCNTAYFNKHLAVLNQNKTQLIKQCRNLGLQTYDSQTNFIVIKTSKHKQLIKHLKTQGILVNDISEYPYNSGLLKEAIRITIPSKLELPRLMLALTNAL